MSTNHQTAPDLRQVKAANLLASLRDLSAKITDCRGNVTADGYCSGCYDYRAQRIDIEQEILRRVQSSPESLDVTP